MFGRADPSNRYRRKAAIVTSDVQHDTSGLRDLGGSAEDRFAHRVTELYAGDAQFRRARPIPAALESARRPGLRLGQVLQTFADWYADRPALGQRATELVTDPQTGRTTSRLLPTFETMSYRDVWSRVTAIAAGLRTDPTFPIAPGDFVATVGFASADYLVIDLVCAYLGLVSVPLQHNAPASRLGPIIAESQPRVVAVSAEYLDLAIESVLASGRTPDLLVVFDHRPAIDDHRENLQRARDTLAAAGISAVVHTIDEIATRGEQSAGEPPYTGGSDQRLAMVMYTSGSTGTPKGAMFTEATMTTLWTSQFVSDIHLPVINVNFMPLNHLGGRLPLVSSFQTGGTSYFVPESDLSTLFTDWNLVRPTELGLVPRVVDMLFQRYRGAVDQRVAAGMAESSAQAQAAAEIRDRVLGGRVVGGFVSTAPLAGEMKAFLDTVLDIHVVDGYGLTEVGAVLRDGVVTRPPVVDYKLVDVPELGYFRTDKPYPRGELLVKTMTATPGYYRRPDTTAAAFDADGYYRTGDIMAEIEPDVLVYVDRRNNVLKLAQGEFVAVARLEAVFAGAPLVRQIFVYGNSERAALLAVIVPTAAALTRFAGDPDGLRSALSESLQRTAKDAELQSFELPVDFIVETQPFSTDNGLLSGVGKLLRPNLKDHYGPRLEQLYDDIAAAQVDQLRALRQSAADRPVVETVTRAAGAILGTAEVDPEAHFTDLGGDSLSALTFSNLLTDVFGVEVPVGVIINPASNLSDLADHVAARRGSGAKRPTFASVHAGPDGLAPTEVRAADLTLGKFLDDTTLAAAPTLPRATGEPDIVLLTGANGWLGRFLALEWLERLARRGGTLVAVVRGRDDDEARARLDSAFDSGDPALLRRYRELADGHLEVLAGDIGEPNLGLDTQTWQRLAERVDLIVHPAALVNHVLPYSQLFGPNVVGTAELIRLALTTRIKPVTYLSTVAVAMTVPPAEFVEDGDIRTVSAVRPIDDGYANGYATSKWAGEVLLREAHDLCGLPVSVFRSDMILAHTRYAGQLNVPDMFTRLIFSLLATGIAPKSFYEGEGMGARPRAHYDGLPVDFVAAAITAIGGQSSPDFRSFDVMNPHDDGVSLDVFVDWLIRGHNEIARIDDYADWLARFETALTALPERLRQHSVLPLLHAFRVPEKPVRGAAAPTGAFRAAARSALRSPDGEHSAADAYWDIPHIGQGLIAKYVSDLRRLGLL
ncbi:MAG: thioester reductase domain-containing protein [Actinobacteria bacterium]|nr:thioester reductase domain-containing protein [Actinomycetota bacterium]